MTTRTRWFFALVAAQAAFLLAWAGWHEHVRAHAAVIRLKTLPVDPQDLLRGDYMILRYEISNATPPPGNDPRRGRGEFWVVLEPRGEFHEAVRTSWTEPEIKPPQIAVKGWTGPRGTSYGIENFYVPEGKGTPAFRKIEVEASVSPTQRLYLKRVLVDGRPYP
jgi:uncharacterized membrane-anchored protein